MAKTIPTILKKIIERKWQEVEERQRLQPLSTLQSLMASASVARGFVQSIEASLGADKAAVIAEIKKASPSKGVIRPDFNPVNIASSYHQAGASCLSVLTDVDFFQGCDEYLQQVRKAVPLPVIRKDFIVSPYQVYESRVLGADCILLIAAALTPSDLFELNSLAIELGLDVLVEVHNLEELELALSLPNKLVGINNRDLHSFEVSLSVTFDLLAHIPKDRIVITESGIASTEEVEIMQSRGVNSFLVGESLMRAQDPGKKMQELFGW